MSFYDKVTKTVQNVPLLHGHDGHEAMKATG